MPRDQTYNATISCWKNAAVSHLTKKRHGTLGDLLEAIVGVLFSCDVRVNLTTPYCAFSTCVTHIEAGTPLSAGEKEDYIILSRVFALRVKS